MKNLLPGREEGMALVTVILLTAVMLGLGAFASRGVQMELRISGNQLLAKKALDVAEAGLIHAYSVIKAGNDGEWNSELSYDGTGGSLAGLGTPTVVNGTNFLFRAFGGGSSDGYYVRGFDNYDERAALDDPTQDNDGKITILSRGRVGTAERIIQAEVESDAPFEQAVFGKQLIKMTGGALTDSFDSRDGAYAPGTARSNGDLRSNGSLVLSGAVTAVHGSAMAGTTITAQTGIVTGGQVQSAPLAPVPSVPACGPPYSANTLVGSGSWNYNANTGSLQVSSGGTVVLTGATYCFSDIKLIAGGVLQVTGPSRVSITGTADFAGGAIVNTTNLASNLQVYSSFTGSNGVKIAGGSSAYLTVYAPDTDITLSGGAAFYGAFVGNTLTNTGGSTIHYDEALGRIFGPNIRLTNWHEIRG